MKRSLPAILLSLLCSMCLVNCQSQKNANMIDKTTVSNVDLEKYQGTWYEIARLPNSFEKDLVGVTATYTLLENGKIRVLNQGYLDSLDGKRKSIKGRAKVPDPDHPGRLKVAFFLFFWSDYYILELDQPDYRWAMIGSSSPGYFWILSREPTLDEAVFSELIRRAENRGYDLSELIMVEQ
jgi:apolipoprotein D and lipocalin family protein